MKSIQLPRLHTLALAALLVALVAPTLDAQTRRGRASVDESPPWAPVSIGARFSYDQEVRTQGLGLSLRVPVVRDGTFELNPSVDNLFVRGQDDRQYNVDLTYVPGGPRGGLILFGGVSWRESIFALLATERTRYFGYNLGAGGKTVLGRVELEVQIKWTFLNDTQLQPNLVSLGLNYPLWGSGIRPPG